MAKLKNPKPEMSLQESLRRSNEEWEKEVVKRTYYVSEITPPYDDIGYNQRAGYKRAVTAELESEEECQEWIDLHVPDDGNYFKINIVTYINTVMRMDSGVF